jgi:hypothetical protein
VSGNGTDSTTALIDAINYALRADPSSVHMVDFAALIRRVRIRRVMLARDGFRPVAHEIGTVLADVPAIVARALQVPADARDKLVLIHLTRDTYERSQAGLVIPS